MAYSDNIGYYDIDDEDYFEEDAFNSEIEAFKNTLRDSVKQELKDKIKHLEEEVAKYKDIKENWDIRVADLEKAKRVYTLATTTLEAELREKIRKETLIDLLGERIDGYGVAYDWVYAYPKCDKCDDERTIHFKSPSGRDYTEPCSCAKQICHYHVRDAKLIEVVSDVKHPVKELAYEYKVDSDDTKEQVSRRLYGDDIDFYNDDKFNELYNHRWWGIVFKRKETAEKFCEIANAKELKKMKEGENK